MRAGSPLIETMLREGSKPVWRIALDAGVQPSAVYNVAKKIGVKAARAKRGEQEAVFPTYRAAPAPREHHEILSDLRDQLEAIVDRFHSQVKADRRIDPMF